jgi:4-hydroxybenzoyl-CoA thioesterase
MAFRTRQPVRHPDVDRAGIVYFPRFYDFFHRALEDFFQSEVGIDFWDLAEHLHVAFPLVHIETDFSRPLKHGDAVTLQLSTVKLGEHSATMRFEVTDFSRPLKHGDAVTLQLSTVKLGEHSATMRFEVFRPGESEPASVSTLVLCCIEVPGWTKAPIPAPVLAAFEKHRA